MKESIPNTEEEKQAELLRKQKDSEEKVRELEAKRREERWNQYKKELSDQFEANTRKIWVKQTYDGIVDRANNPQLTPAELKPDLIIDKVEHEKALRDANAEVDRLKFEWLKEEYKKFIKAEKAEQERQARLAQERAAREEKTGKLYDRFHQEIESVNQPETPPRQEPDKNRSRAHYDGLREAGQAAANQKTPSHDTEMKERIERNRALLREEQERERER